MDREEWKKLIKEGNRFLWFLTAWDVLNVVALIIVLLPWFRFLVDFVNLSEFIGSFH